MGVCMCGEGGGATPALAISMSFHGAPQWMLGDSVAGADLSLHRRNDNPLWHGELSSANGKGRLPPESPESQHSPATAAS